MKITGIVVAVLIGSLVLGYYVISRPRPILENRVNPDGVNNLHLVDADPMTGFAIYRLGDPGPADVRGLCALGVSEIVVLSGSALDYEVAHRDECPELEIVYNVEDDLTPLTGEWLGFFDAWVERARRDGRKIAFRCSCGCHRTGRLAAYYQMKYKGLDANAAWHLALSRGWIMEAVDYFGGLQEQIIALHEYIHGQPCSQGEYCVQEEAVAQEPCEAPLEGCGWPSELVAQGS